jgi:carbamoyl-phosphate synthase large subunit
MSLRILITAVGGDFGQALVKALRLNRAAFEIHGCDMDTAGVGSAFVDSYHVVPPARETDSYVEALDTLCRNFEIQAVIPGSEPEIAALSRLSSFPRLPSGAALICQPAQWLDTYGDKLNCMRALEGKVELVPFADGEDKPAVERLLAQTDFPVIVKSRRSSGSRTLRIAHDAHGLKHALADTPAPLVQQYIDDGGGEYTAGVFVCEQFSTMIAFKRELNLVGCSWYAENSDDEEVLDYVRRVAVASGLSGSANVQVRKGAAGVRLLEINPRFSSLVAARAVCGFRDAEWSLGMALGHSLASPAQPYRRIRFRRFFHEMIDLGEGFRAVSEWSPQEIKLTVG